MSQSATLSASADVSAPRAVEPRSAGAARGARRAAARDPRISQGRSKTPATSRRGPARSRLGAALMRLYRGEAPIVPAESIEPSGSPAAPSSGTPRVAESVAPEIDRATASRGDTSHAAASEHAGADRPRPSLGERRAFPRRESICLVSVYRNENDAPVNQQEVRWLLHSSPLRGGIDDISMNGVAFLLPEPMEAGAKLLMRLANRRLDRHFDTSGRVVRAIPDGMGEWKIVCRFDRNLTLDQVHEYGQNLFVSGLV